MLIRILTSIILLILILFMPFWVSALLALAGMIYFSVFWEGTVLFLLSDLLYGVREPKFFGFTFISFILSIFVLIIVEIVKKKTRLR